MVGVFSEVSGELPKPLTERASYMPSTKNPPKEQAAQVASKNTKTVVLVRRIERGEIVSEDRLEYEGYAEAVIRFGKGRAA